MDVLTKINCNYFSNSDIEVDCAFSNYNNFCPTSCIFTLSRAIIIPFTENVASTDPRFAFLSN